MKKQVRHPYVSPQIEVIQIENEGTVMAASPGGTGNGYSPGGNWGGATTPTPTTKSYNSTAGSSDLEDLINDILTVEQ